MFSSQCLFELMGQIVSMFDLATLACFERVRPRSKLHHVLSSPGGTNRGILRNRRASMLQLSGGNSDGEAIGTHSVLRSTSVSDPIGAATPKGAGKVKVEERKQARRSSLVSSALPVHHATAN